MEERTAATASTRVMRGLATLGLVTFSACSGLFFETETEPENTYDDMSNMSLTVTFERGGYLPALTRCMTIAILPRDDWGSADDPCPRLPGLQVTVDDLELEEPYLFDPGEPSRCAQLKTLYCRPVELADAAPGQLSALSFDYREQAAGVAIQDPWSAPYWRLVSQHEEIHGQIVVSPGDTLAFELSYGQSLVTHTEMTVEAFYSTTDVQSGEDVYLERYISQRYDMGAGQYLIDVASDAEVGADMALDLVMHLPSTASECEGWSACEVSGYPTGRSLNLAVR